MGNYSVELPWENGSRLVAQKYEGVEMRFDDCMEIWWLEELRRRYSMVHGYLGFAVCLFGVLSNLANIVVLTRRYLLSSTNLLLCALAVANATKMMSFIPVYAHFYMVQPEETLFHTRSAVWVYYLLVQITLGIMLHALALYITISIAVFRYLYIRFPLRGAEFCSLKNTVIVVLLVTALSTLISIPNIVCNDMGIAQGHNHTESSANNNNNKSSADDFGNQTETHDVIYTIKPSDSWPFVQVMNMWVQSIFIRFIPCIMLTLFTVLLLIEMRKAMLRREALRGKRLGSKGHGSMSSGQQNASKEKENDRTTAMLLAVVIMFLIVEFPQGVLAVANSISDCFYGKVYMAVGDLLDLITLTNNAVNFIIYTTMSRQFRQSFVRIFWTSWSDKCCCFGKRDKKKKKNNGNGNGHDDDNDHDNENRSKTTRRETSCAYAYAQSSPTKTGTVIETGKDKGEDKANENGNEEEDDDEKATEIDLLSAQHSSCPNEQQHLLGEVSVRVSINANDGANRNRSTSGVISDL